ncbi:MAG: sugar ABC transporter permease [Roseiflexaceae bacterium]|nr:sugar ABC transporter permease [Roseiflexaceae bacterium]
MATTTIPAQAAEGNPALTARVAAVWHVLLALAGAGVLFTLFQTTWPREWLRIAALAVVAAWVPLNVYAAVMLVQRKHAGRAFSVILNYLGLTGFVLAALNAAGVFLGLDVVGDRFRSQVFWLSGVMIGFLIGGVGDSYSHDPSFQRTLHRIGNGLMLGSIAAMLLLMGALQGLFFVLTQLLTPNGLLLLAGALLFGLMFWAVFRPQSAAYFGATSRDSEMLSGYMFIAPNLLGFVLFFAGPLLFSLYLSLTNSDGFTAAFVGIRNYVDIFSLDFAQLQESGQRASTVLQARYVELTRFSLFGSDYIIGAKDKQFWIALGNTAIFCLFTTLLAVVPPLLIANILNTKIPGMQFFRAIYFIPSIAGVVGVAVIWKWLYNSNVGFLNYGLSAMVGVLNVIPGLNLPPPDIAWLSSQQTALLSIIIMAAWQLLGFNTILFLAGLQGIPGEVYEAAEIDGATGAQRFRSMTLPLLAPTTIFVVTTTLISTLQVFSEVVVMTPPPGGGPNNATLTSVLYLYQRGFKDFQQGYSAAVAWVLFFFIFLITLAQLRISRRYSDA